MVRKHNLISTTGTKFDLFIKRNKFKFAFRYKIIHGESKERGGKKTRKKVGDKMSKGKPEEFWLKSAIF